MSNGAGERPAFTAPLYAALRQGSKEIAQNVLPAFPTSARPVEEMGTLGNPTPQMLTRAMDGQAGPCQPEDQGYQAMFNAHAARGDMGREQQQKGMER
jgi:hypothetical protein